MVLSPQSAHDRLERSCACRSSDHPAGAKATLRLTRGKSRPLLLDMFSGTHSVGKVAHNLGYDVVSLDLADATICCDVLEWDYTQYPVGYFDVVNLCGHRRLARPLVVCDVAISVGMDILERASSMTC